MSAVYNLEPNPTAKVILHTTTGDLEIELWAKQTPKAARNFLQLCLDGYYDNTIFHRLVKGFILQGGDPTGTGQGGESSYDGQPFEDEFHSRLRYNRRGLVGMANTGKNDNGSQFFFTLGATPELESKNTLFGRIQGDTIYNLMKMADAEIAEGSEDRPLYPTKIKDAEIIINPFEDMVKRARQTAVAETAPKKAKKPKRKAGNALLSFGGDDGEEMETVPVAKKAKFNAALVSAGPNSTLDVVEKSIPIRKPARTSPRTSPSPRPSLAPAKVKAPRSPSPPAPASPPREPSPPQSKLDRVNAQIEAVKASMRRSTVAADDQPERKKSKLEAMIPASAIKGRRRGGASNATANQATLDLLSRFKSKLESAPAPKSVDVPDVDTPGTGKQKSLANGSKTTAADEEEVPCDLHFIVGCQSCTAWDKQGEAESDDDTGWMSHSLSFAKDRLGKDLEWKRKNEEELTVIDPLEKARDLKASKKSKREWDDGKDQRGSKGVALGSR